MPNIVVPKIVDFTMGADPELTCMEGRKIVESGNYTDESAMFGCDGNGVTFEIRPSPSMDPLQVVTNIHEIFVKQAKTEPRYLKYKWMAGSFFYGYPMGGHIHFGTKGKVEIKTAVTHLDHYTGSISMLIEQTNQGKARRKYGYGKMGDYREQHHGFEYRTPSSWLTSPYVAAAMLCLSKTVIYELLNNPNFDWKAHVSSKNFNQMEVEAVRAKFPDIWKDITQMSQYQVYKPYIDLLYHLITKKLTWFPNSTMKEAWGLVDVTKYQKNKFDIGMIWNRFQSINSSEITDNNDNNNDNTGGN